MKFILIGDNKNSKGFQDPLGLLEKNKIIKGPNLYKICAVLTYPRFTNAVSDSDQNLGENNDK